MLTFVGTVTAISPAGVPGEKRLWNMRKGRRSLPLAKWKHIDWLTLAERRRSVSFEERPFGIMALTRG